MGDSITTDHISPAGSIKADSPAGKYLQSKGVAVKDFNSYGSRRGNHEVMMRGTFANIRIRNEMVPGVEGGFTKYFQAVKFCQFMMRRCVIRRKNSFSRYCRKRIWNRFFT